MESKVNVRVLELEPGWLLARFDGPKPAPSTREHWLRLALGDWQTKRGNRKIERVERVEHEGQLLGLMAWTPIPPPRPVRVHRDVKSPKEHIEALLQHAYQILCRDTSGEDTIVVVNRAGVAVVFEEQVARVLPLDQLSADPRLKSDFAEWRKTDGAAYFCARLRPRPRPE